LLKYAKILLAIIAPTAIVLLAVVLLAPQPKSPPKLTTVRSEPVSLSTLVGSIKTRLTNTLPNLQLAPAPDETNAIGYQLPGYNFEVILPPVSGSLSFSDSAASSETASYQYFRSSLPIITSVLQQHGFSKIPTTQPADSLLSAVYFYKSAATICQVTTFTVLDVTCASLSEVESIATNAQSMVAEYATARPDAGQLAINAPTATASQTAGYTLGQLSVHDNTGQTTVNYYKSATNGWQMIDLGWYNDPYQNASITPNCEDFESVVAVRAAYAGQACYDSSRLVQTTIH
jgi:hypothetical protein